MLFKEDMGGAEFIFDTLLEVVLSHKDTPLATCPHSEGSCLVPTAESSIPVTLRSTKGRAAGEATS